MTATVTTMTTARQIEKLTPASSKEPATGSSTA